MRQNPFHSKNIQILFSCLMRGLMIFLLMALSGSNVLAAAEEQSDTASFQRYNPDGQKYEFVKDYITSLSYFKLNALRIKKKEGATEQDVALSDTHLTKAHLQDLILDSMNIRVARNLLKKHLSSNNKLILKVSGLFKKVCNDQIDMNEKEKAIFERLYQAQTNNQMQGFDYSAFVKEQTILSQSRRDSLQELLEASLLVNKVLISPTMEYKGEPTVLGITQEQRGKLLSKLDAFFYGSKATGGLKAGQTYLEGSVAAIREVLEDEAWNTL